MPVSPARAAAFEILLRIETTDAYASELLHSSRFAKLSPADHGLLPELVMGVLRWSGVLDKKIAGHYGRSSEDRAPADWSASTKIPDRSPAHPDWLVERWTRIYGSDIAGKICEYNQSAPSPVVRMTSAQRDVGIAAPGCPPGLGPGSFAAASSELRSTGQPRAAVPTLEELRSEAIQIEPGKLLSTAYTVTSGDITQTKAFRERRLIVQDEASQLVALLVGNGENILDCCAAPGGKTRIVAERNPEALIVAMDLHPRRAALLQKLGVAGNVRVVSADTRAIPFSGGFDRILVDAPCSGTGTLARNPEIKWRLKPEDLPR